METKIKGVVVEGYLQYNIARFRGNLTCSWDEFYTVYNKYSKHFLKPTLFFLSNTEFILIEEDDFKFLSRNNSKGYTLDNGKFRVRIQYKHKSINKYCVSESDAIHEYKQLRCKIIMSIISRLSLIYDDETIDKFKTKILAGY